MALSFSLPPLPKKVSLIEVGPRDGLQNEEAQLSVEARLSLIDHLVAAGLKTIEAGSFVSPRWVPQMAHTEEILKILQERYVDRDDLSFPVLVPNVKGYEFALNAGAKTVAVIFSASETFSKKNINASIGQSLEQMQPIFDLARKDGILVRGYISCVWGCPYEGVVSFEAVQQLSQMLIQQGVYEVSLADTIGVATPRAVQNRLKGLFHTLPQEKFAVHFHDTYGQAVANVYAALLMGVDKIDAAAGGLGGCPYALGATGNVATEDVLYLLNGLDIETGVSLEEVIEATRDISQHLNKTPPSRVATAYIRKNYAVSSMDKEAI